MLDLIAYGHHVYSEILSKLSPVISLLLQAAALDNNLRKLLFDGAPSSSALYGLDIKPPLFDLGYQFSRDRYRGHGTFRTVSLTRLSVPSIEPFTFSSAFISAQSLF